MSTMIAVASPPAIVCPDWCTTPEAVHVERLADHDGEVSHDSDWVGGFSYSTVTFVDGTPVPGRPATIYVEEYRMPVRMLDGVTVDDAETFARQVLQVVEEARS
ncbi:MAG: hypothetical protein WKF79_03365 [Nocardioides sp.]